MALNPVVFTEKVVRSFLRYQLTAYRTYGRYFPNLTRQDGSAFERQLANALPPVGDPA